MSLGFRQNYHKCLAAPALLLLAPGLAREAMRLSEENTEIHKQYMERL